MVLDQLWSSLYFYEDDLWLKEGEKCSIELITLRGDPVGCRALSV